MPLQPGDKVRYCPKYKGEEKGIVKSINDLDQTTVFVVFNCDNKLDNYTNYTASSTRITDLKLGWED